MKLFEISNSSKSILDTLSKYFDSYSNVGISSTPVIRAFGTTERLSRGIVELMFCNRELTVHQYDTLLDNFWIPTGSYTPSNPRRGSITIKEWHELGKQVVKMCLTYADESILNADTHNGTHLEYCDQVKHLAMVLQSQIKGIMNAS